MSEAGDLDIFHKALDKPHPFTEEERASRRNAAGFAIEVFAPGFLDHDRQARIGVELSDQQIQFAGYFREAWPNYTNVLPEADLNAVRSGYGHISSDVLEIIPTLLQDPHYGDEYRENNPDFISTIERRQKMMEKDPSGVSYLQSELAEMEDKGSQAQLATIDKIPAVNALYEAIEEAVKEIPDEPLPPDPAEPSFRSFIVNFFGGNRTQREIERDKRRYELFKETGVVQDAEGNTVPYDVLQVIGARHAFEKYKRAVDFYLSKWGPEQSKAS